MVPAAGSSTFDVTFNPSSAGVQTVEISITSNDPDENPYTFNIQGEVSPDIEIVGNGTIIVDGQTTISATDNTDFGLNAIGTPVIHQFTINNIGTADLFISLPPTINDLGTGISDFSVTNPSFLVPAMGSSIFDVIKNAVEINFETIANPKLWDTNNPNLYTLSLDLLDGDSVKDNLSDRVGFRWFEFKDYGAFYLNGKRLLLRGTHRHEEGAGVGAAMSNKQHRADMELIKDMGANIELIIEN